MLLVIDDKIPFIRHQAEQLGSCTYLPGAAITAADVRHADALIVRTRTRCDRTLLEGSRVQLVVTATIGYDHLDTAYLDAAGIAWTNCPGCNATSVAQYVRNALLRASAAGHIDTAFALGRKSALTVGVVGCGHVGSAVAHSLEAEGCRVLRCDPPKGETATLTDLAEAADVITLHTPLTTDGDHPTFHLADEAFFRHLRRRPLFINAARGECMDTAAVKNALREGRIAAAVIDTWEHEPNIDPELLDAAFIATPHIAGYSADGKACGTRMALETVARHFGIERSFPIVAPPLAPDFRYGSPVEQPDRFSPRALEQLRLYDPATDTDRLRRCPADFERLRGDYPFRREHP